MNNKRTIFEVIMAAVMMFSVGVSVYAINSNNIAYNSNNVSTVQEALDTLYDSVEVTTILPVGSVVPYMGTSAPTNYLICDGSTYNINDYKKLADHIKDNFGSYNYFGGDGTTTFAVPDLRGEFLRGAGTAARNTGTGAEVGVHQDATIHNNGASFHHEPTGYYLGGQLYSTYASASYPGNTDKNTETAGNTWILPSSITLNSNQSKGITTYTSRPTNTSVNYIIKVK